MNTPSHDFPASAIRHSPPESVGKENRPARKLLHVSIHKLFGYKEPINFSINEMENMVLLYGDNGTGKTTIMNLIYHILAPSRNQGHKTWIANCAFEKVELKLSGHVAISVDRIKSNRALIGDFDFTVIDGSEHASHSFVSEQNESDGKFSIKMSPQNEKTYRMVTEKMQNLGLRLVYLTDSRKFYSDGSNDTSAFSMRSGENYMDNEKYAKMFSKSDGVDLTEIQKALMLSSCEDVRRHLDMQIRNASHLSDKSDNVFYKTMIRAIIQDKKEDLFDFMFEIDRISKESVRFEKYGLVKPFDFEYIKSNYKDTTDAHRLSIEKVIRPFLEAYSQRLEKLSETQDKIEKYILTINSFLSGKEISYSFLRGIGIKLKNGSIISPASLSSGERNLIVLINSVVANSNNNTLFFIDEPELSLNLAWQREFVTSISSLANKKTNQFVFATHSLEMLSQNTHILAEIKS